MPNRLAQSQSPYLRQHADNPVDWVEWSDEAFLRAKIEQKPVFLSVGYSSCHWCHVMAHESFEDPEVAAVLNAHFINVKVDREERPDVDEVYMTAVQVSTGRGGWPMTLFLTPDRKPFFAGTYFPKDDRGQYPGFLTLARQISQGWLTSRDEFEKAAAEFASALRQLRERGAPVGKLPLGGELLSEGLRGLFESFDPEHGGFGDAPKFPPHSAIELLLTLMASTLEGDETDAIPATAALVASKTLDAMALGGLYDVVGGGFHRYATDREWHLPHFEKMLGDNAMLLTNYAMGAHLLRAASPERAELYRNVVERTVQWVAREMTSPEGFFYSALDADSEGEEGFFYTWPRAELLEVSSAELADALGVSDEGNFLDEATGVATGRNVLTRRKGVDISKEVLDQLVEARACRERPGLDDKALASWNGLMIAALVLAGAVPLAAQAAEAWIKAIAAHGGELPHQVVQNVPSGRAFAEDYAAMAFGLITLADAVDENLAKRYVMISAKLMQTLGERFEDPGRGGFFSTTQGHETQFGRAKGVTDAPLPSANALAVRVLLRLGDRDRAFRTLDASKSWIEALPHATEALQLALLEFLQSDPGAVETEAASPAVPGTPAEIPAVTVALSGQELAFDGGEARGEIRITIPADWHINGANPPARWMIPTAVSVQPMKFRVDYPAGDIYTGTVVIPFAILEKGEFEITVSYQACTDRDCLEPVERRFDGVAR